MWPDGNSFCFVTVKSYSFSWHTVSDQRYRFYCINLKSPIRFSNFQSLFFSIVTVFVLVHLYCLYVQASVVVLFIRKLFCHIKHNTAMENVSLCDRLQWPLYSLTLVFTENVLVSFLSLTDSRYFSRRFANNWYIMSY